MAKKNKKMLKVEKMLTILIGFLFFANIFGSSFSMALLSKTNIEVESMKKKISKQEDANEALEMKINELASIDNVEAVALLYGLEYNNSNIVVVDND